MAPGDIVRIRVTKTSLLSFRNRVKILERHELSSVHLWVLNRVPKITSKKTCSLWSFERVQSDTFYQNYCTWTRSIGTNTLFILTSYPLVTSYQLFICNRFTEGGSQFNGL